MMIYTHFKLIYLYFKKTAFFKIWTKPINYAFEIYLKCWIVFAEIMIYQK
jgi:hypothetical protein